MALWRPVRARRKSQIGWRTLSSGAFRGEEGAPRVRALGARGTLRPLDWEPRKRDPGGEVVDSSTHPACKRRSSPPDSRAIQMSNAIGAECGGQELGSPQRTMRDHRSPHKALSGELSAYLQRLFSVATTASEAIPDDQAAELLVAVKWPDGPVCPRCGSTSTAPLGGPKNTGKGRLRCLECHAQLSPLSGTPLENEKSRPSVILAAAGLATRHRGPELARRIEDITGVSGGSAARVALRMQDLFDRFTAPRRGNKGQVRALKAGLAALLLAAVALGSAWAYVQSGSPLVFRWDHQGNQMEFTTAQRHDESRAEWTARHARRTEDLLKRFPPDEAE